MRLIKVNHWACRYNQRGINGFMATVVVRLIVVYMYSIRYTLHLIKVSHITPKVRVISDTAKKLSTTQIR